MGDGGTSLNGNAESMYTLRVLHRKTNKNSSRISGISKGFRCYQVQSQLAESWFEWNWVDNALGRHSQS